MTAAECQVCKRLQKHYFDYANYHYCRCPYCGLVSTLPIPERTEIERHYEKRFNTGNYSLLSSYRKEYRQVYLDFVGALNSRLWSCGKTLRGQKILDIGCFTGDLLLLLQEKGADVYGIELQPDAVAIANTMLPGRIFMSDVYEDNFPQEQYDIITLTGVIEHLIDPVGLIQRVFELLTPGGFILLQTPNSGSFIARIMGKYWPPYAPVEHIHLFSRRSMRMVLEKSGFRDVVFKRHMKKLPIAYVYQMLNNFGPEFHRLLAPLYNLCSSRIKGKSFIFYAGEMIATAVKPCEILDILECK
ncbi:MAG: class I SAM-dependent methyltransferase [Nitrospirae bacterium]|nr:class I SAM-dependent methyltransferase [Nitrospirota bacterium]